MESTALLDQPASTASPTVTDSEGEHSGNVLSGSIAQGPLVSPPAPDTSTPATAAPDSSPDEEDNDDGRTDDGPVSASLEQDSLEFDKATVSIYLQLLPHDGHADGRPIIIGVRSHNLVPLTITRRWSDVQPLPEVITTLVTQWQAHYIAAVHARTQAREALRAKEKAKEDKRKSDAKRRQEDLKAQQAARKATTTTAAAKPRATPATAAVKSPVPAVTVPQSTLF